MCDAFNVGKAKAAIITISDQAETNRSVISLRRLYPDLKIFARAKDANHQRRLQNTLDVAAMVPILPEDNILLTLPFGGAVLKSLGAPAEEVREYPKFVFKVHQIRCICPFKGPFPNNGS